MTQPTPCETCGGPGFRLIDNVTNEPIKADERTYGARREPCPDCAAPQAEKQCVWSTEGGPCALPLNHEGRHSWKKAAPQADKVPSDAPYAGAASAGVTPEPGRIQGVSGAAETEVPANYSEPAAREVVLTPSDREHIDTLREIEAYFRKEAAYERENMGAGGSTIALGRWKRYYMALSNIIGDLPTHADHTRLLAAEREQAARLKAELNSWIKWTVEYKAQRDQLQQEVAGLRRYRDDMHDTLNTLATVLGCTKNPEALIAAATAAEQRVNVLEADLREAIEDIDSWAGYASEYFVKKHNLKGCLEKHRSVLSPAKGEK